MPERNQQTRAVHKAEIHRQNAVVSHVHATEVLHPCDGAFDFPAFAVTPQLAFVFVAPQHAVAAVGSNPIDAASAHVLPQRIAVIALIGNHAPWLAPGTAAAPGLPEKSFREILRVEEGYGHVTSF